MPPPCGLETTKQDDGFLITASDAFKTPFVAVADPAACKTSNLSEFADNLPDAHIVAPQEHMLDLMVSVVTQTNERTSVDPTVSVAALEDLPIVEVPSELKNQDDRLAIVLTGDGGWADIDRTIGEELAKQGVATIGFNSLKYFWEPQKPEDAAADLERVIRYYMKAWNRSRVVLVGFSFGADILPFLEPHLSRDVHQHLALTALLAPSLHASYEISVGGWVGVEDDEGPEVAPAIAAMKTPLLCVQSADEEEHPCDKLTNANLETVVMQGDHHFDGNYMPIVTQILAKTKQ
jgi:type IV secretory pathway VirJ component